SVEQHSEHPLAQGIVKAAEEREIRLSNVTNFASITGQGISGMIDEKNIRIVSPGYMNKNQLHYDEDYFNRVAEEGKTVVFVLQEETLKGMIVLADLVRETAKEAIQELHEQDIHTVMLTGDNERGANWVAKQLAIDEVYAEILPEEKANKVKEIQQRGCKPGMAIDDINDDTALATADLGIAMDASTDVTMESAVIVLLSSNPKVVVTLMELSKLSQTKMVQNLWWALGYKL